MYVLYYIMCLYIIINKKKYNGRRILIFFKYLENYMI